MPRQLLPTTLLSLVLIVFAVGILWFALRGKGPSNTNTAGNAGLTNRSGGEVITPSNRNASGGGELPPLGSIASDSGNIVVSSPLPGEEVVSPITVSGRARVFENTVNIRIKNRAGDVLVQEIATANAPDIGEFGDFSVNIFYSFSSTKEGVVEIYSTSAKDGSEQDLVSISVTFT